MNAQQQTAYDVWQTRKVGNPDALLLHRIGDFYECYYSDAVVVAHALRLQTTKINGRAVVVWPVQIFGYIRKLIQSGYPIIIEDVE